MGFSVTICCIFKAFLYTPVNGKQNGVLSSVPPQPACCTGLGWDSAFAAKGTLCFCLLHRGWLCKVGDCSLGRGDPGAALCCREGE